MRKILVLPFILLFAVIFSVAIKSVWSRGYYKYEPSIHISNAKDGYSAGGLVSIASTDEPAINIGSYDSEGNAELNLYEADENILFDYLTHDDKGNQIKKNIDTSRLKHITTINQYITKGYDKGSHVTLPLSESGIWLLRTKLGNSIDQSVILRTNIGVLTKEGEKDLIFWTQNFKTGKSVPAAQIITYNLENSIKEINKTDGDSNGVAKTPFSKDIDIAYIKSGGDIATVPLNLKYLNTGYSGDNFQPKINPRKYFVFTDRPLYKPGDTIYFKAVIREDNDARYSIPQGLATVKIYQDENTPVFEKNYQITSDGTVYGETKLEENVKTGYYYLKVILPKPQGVNDEYFWESNSTSFQIEFFRKPEYSIDMEASTTELISKDPLTVTVSGKYFSGQPITQGDIEYTINPVNFWEYEYKTDSPVSLNDEYRYGSWYAETKNQIKGQVSFNSGGLAKIEVPTAITDGKTKVFSIEAVYDNGSGNPSLARKNVLVHSGEYGIYKKDRNGYSVKVKTPIKYPVLLSPLRETNIKNIPLTVKVHRENWVKYIDPNQKYPQYRKEEEDLPPFQTITDNSGVAEINYIPQKIGSYRLTVEGQDKIGNLISKSFYSWVQSEDVPVYSSNQDTIISLTPDKDKYSLKENMNLTITSEMPDRDVFLSIERGRTDRYQVVSLKGKSAVVSVPVVEADMPNIYVYSQTFSNSALELDSKDIAISTDTKKLIVAVTPDKKIYGPANDVTLNITSTDFSGNPVSSDLAVWAVDKALFELVDEKPEKIFDTFWDHRYQSSRLAHSLEGINVQSGAEGGGCFTADTKIFMADNSLKEISQIKPNDKILTKENNKLVKAKVSAVKIATASGLLILNQNLKTTPDHLIKINDAWQVAANAQIGDKLETPTGPQNITSVEYIKGVNTVYNLEVEKYHTFFAENYLVHNQKGTAREVFKDTAYWNPSVRTDGSGRAKITFKLPDNLTTWVVSALGATTDTKAGQVTSDIIVSKSVIVRPVLPNILRLDDKIIFSALVQNFTNNPEHFDVNLDFDSGSVEEPDKKDVLIAPNETKQLYWKVTANKENEKAMVDISAVSKENKDNQDRVKLELPVLPFGFYEKNAQNGDGSKKFNISLDKDTDPGKTKITLSLSPTTLGTLPQAMKYLVDYPYGCTEQTTSRFVPAVIAKSHPDLFAESLKDKNLDEIIQKGIARLSVLQHPDGGWSWWNHGNSDLFITSYVFEYINLAKTNGAKVDEQMLMSAQIFLENFKTSDAKDFVLKNYPLSLIHRSQPITTDLLDKLSPDILSIAVLAILNNGNNDPNTNGLALLKSKAQNQGDSLYWTKGAKNDFSSDDASTALALRAFLAAGDRETAVKAARFLQRNKKQDYWSNTFATSQVVRAITDLSVAGNESDAFPSYSVTLDGKPIANNKLIDIPGPEIKKDGSVLEIQKEGEGQFYSTLVINQFHTDKNSPAASNGLSIKREYISEKGETSSLAVGDTVTVKLTVSGLKTEENYMVIDDALPAGLVPINPTFKNEAENSYYTSYEITDYEIIQNGIVLSLYRAAPGEKTYTYKARVIAEGEFIAPPATVSLMYSPEIHGRSNPQIVKTTGEAVISPISSVKQKPNIMPLFAALTILTPALIIILIKKKLETRI